MAFEDEELLQLLSIEVMEAKQLEVMSLLMLATAESLASGELTPGDPEWKALGSRCSARQRNRWRCPRGWRRVRRTRLARRGVGGGGCASEAGRQHGGAGHTCRRGVRAGRLGLELQLALHAGRSCQRSTALHEGGGRGIHIPCVWSVDQESLATLICM
ncbi:hypothetical protein Zm00014a_032951 [Zea mays]|uniref:Uncharacterized protein n=1 Tax=Zea mays TaxID=4577 RepID=A0A3L6F6M7_MAIZE|nr:hypothetical protein Zm00014a_032951 [Zea mays]